MGSHSVAEIVEPLLNLYCFVEEHLYVNEPLVYKITLRNAGTKILHLTATLNQSNSFMFSGHKQVSVLIVGEDESVFINSLPAERVNLFVLFS